jgi:hypothetical protein
MSKIMASRQRVGKQREPLCRRNKYAYIAVAKDIPHLLRLQQRIERDEYAAGSRRAETRDNRFEAFFQVDCNALSSLESKAHEPAVETAYGVREFAVTQSAAVVGQGWRLGGPVRGKRDQIGQKGGVSHRIEVSHEDVIGRRVVSHSRLGLLRL